jgi:hypothetical protein
LRQIKFGVITLLIFGLAIALTGIVSADHAVPAVPETQGLVTNTGADVVGVVMETDAGAWSITNGTTLASTWTEQDWFDNQFTTVYDANIVAQAGHTVLVKGMDINTGNKVISQSNLQARTTLTYVATSDGGNIIGSENIMLDGQGDAIHPDNLILCPFAAVADGVIPAYCNIVQAGSKYDLTIGSVTTNANDMFIGSDAALPVVLNYNINVKPYGMSQGQIPAIGSAMAYMNAHIQEGNISYYIFYPGKAEDLTYSEVSSVQGTITTFNKDMRYSSQVTSIAVLPTQKPV